MRKLLCIIFAALTCFLPQMTQAAEKKFTFSHLNLEDGLSRVSVNDIWLDPSGVIWIATAEGLDSYDGNTITPHCPPPRDTSRNSEAFRKAARWQR